MIISFIKVTKLLFFNPRLLIPDINFGIYPELRNVTFRPSLRGGAKRRRGNLRKDGIASLHFVPLAMTERASFVIQSI
jgi:hypothetical protein